MCVCVCVCVSEEPSVLQGIQLKYKEKSCLEAYSTNDIFIVNNLQAVFVLGLGWEKPLQRKERAWATQFVYGIKISLRSDFTWDIVKIFL